MVLFDKFFDIFCKHAAVVNDDPAELEKEVEIVQKKCGPWCRVRGFTSFQQLFLALHVAKAKNHPYYVAFVKENEEEAGTLILKKSDPNIKTVCYSDTQTLSTMELVSR